MIWKYAKKAFLVMSLLLLLGVGVAFGVVHSRGGKLLSVQSGSMVPFLSKGDLVTVTEVPASQLKVGDVITYINPLNKKQTITHRIVQIPSVANHQKFVVRGDANHADDAPFDGSQIVGKLKFSAPYLGYGVDFVRKPIGLLFLIYVPALFIMIDELLRLARYYKQQQPYKLPGREQPKEKTPFHRKAAGISLTLLCLSLILGVAVPARAALMSQANLIGNSIVASRAVTPSNHILLRRVEFECSSDNTSIVNKLPSIIMYNPGNTDTNTGGWYLQSSNGRLVTFPSKTLFDSKDDYDIEPDLRAGVNYNGDFLALFDNNNNLVDAISWGTDNSYLQPPLPIIHDGSLFRRVALTTDSDTSSDWAVSTGASCATTDQ